MPHCGLAVLIITTSQNLSHEKSAFTKDCTPSALLNPPVPVFQGGCFSSREERPLNRGLFSNPMICRLPGHGKMETMARYAHLARDSAQEAAERVAASIAEDPL